MRFREQSEVGWLMLQLMGSTSLPYVTRDEVKRAQGLDGMKVLFRGRAGGKTLNLLEGLDEGMEIDVHPAQATFFAADSVTGSGLPQTRSPGPAPSVMADSDAADAMAYAMDAFRTVDSGRYVGTLAEAQPRESLAARARRLVEKYLTRKGLAPVLRCVGCGESLGGTFGSVCMNCDVDPPEEGAGAPESFTLRGASFPSIASHAPRPVEKAPCPDCGALLNHAPDCEYFFWSGPRPQ